ncbi:tRNA-adenosine deaminase [Desulfocicer vacuolatum DSM 3385]|uniref:tRNA-specific adenosine deaminase n=1 Tax=Desulfocicer vacuolatum DSM 3385 TaxID=1121400 RepID=A0A1W2B979_9BACT|nr:tRNA adenosine(34) deaminase TadA [Desulfocicer vacuolatum]SMC68908.1 tRNA-adenosine deaminase [Desulfocicer vacuolatum DSM 3385]
MNERDYMKLALEQALKARQLDEVPVGAVVVDSKGDVIGQGHNQTITQTDPSAHAEMLALRSAAKKTGNYRLGGATLYTTIEPCIMCMGAVIHARLSRVVFGAPDPRWGAAGALYNFASDARLNHNLEVVSGICEDETRAIIRSFFRNKRRKKCQTS